MPKIFLKQKNQNRVISLINSNNSSELNSETNVSENNSNNIFTDIKPSFPPSLMVNDIIKNALTSNNNNKPKSLPNAFIVYRMALIKEYRIKNHKLPSMGEVSRVAKNSWNMEPKHVKEYYESLVKDAKSIYRQNIVQIVLDKHMDDSRQPAIDSRVTYDVEMGRTENLLNNNISFLSIGSTNNSLNNPSPNCNFFNPPYELNSTLNHQEEYINMLEQVIDCLLIN